MNALFIHYLLDLKQDQTWKADLTWHYSNAAAEIDQKDIEEVTFKVVSRSGQVYKISTSRKLLRTELPGVSVNAPDNLKKEPQTTTLEAGRLFALPAWNLDRNTKRLSRLFDFGNLPAVETWQIRNPEGELPASETVVDEVPSTTPGYREWRWDFRELAGPNPLTGVGFLWTREKDGMPSAMRIDAKNAVLPGGSDLVDLTIELRIATAGIQQKD